MAMKYKEMVEKEGSNLFPGKVDAATRDLIYQWFKNREVCNDEDFPLYFRRTLNIYWEPYQEKLRIQPGYAHFDWLVNKYNENQDYSEYQNDFSINETTKGTGSITKVYNSGNSTLGSIVDTTTKTGDDTVDGNYTDRLGTSQTQTTNTEGTSNITNNNTTTIDETSTDTPNLTSTTETRKGQDITTTTTDTPRVSTTVNNEGITDNKNVEKQLPMETSSIGELDIHSTYGTEPLKTIGGLNWDYASSQNQQAGYTSDKSTTTQTGENTSTSITSFDKTEGAKDTETNTQTGNNVQKRDGTNKVNIVSDGTTTSDTTTNISNTGSNSGSTKSTQTYNSTVKSTREYTGFANNKTGNDADNRDLTDTKTGNNQDKGYRLNQQINTGRFGNVAQLLMEAEDFIESSVAWEFLYNKLNLCFQLFFDI